MKKTVSNITGEVILSYQENGYQEVIDTFNKSHYINIVTYNINSFIRNSHLVASLKDISSAIPITLILNVPPQNHARSINYILILLERKKFGNLNVYFNFFNHAKLVMTDSVAYIGSQNFSDASRDNYELGVLIREQRQLRMINTVIFEELKANSILYSTSEYNVVMEEISELLNSSIRDIRQQIFTVHGDGYPVPEQEIFDIHQAYFDKNKWRNFEELFGNFEDVVNRIIEGYQDVINQEPIQSDMYELDQSITQFISELEELSIFARFTEEPMKWDKFHEIDTGENLDENLEKVESVVRLYKEEEFQHLENSSDILIELFDRIEEQIQNILDGIHEIREDMISRTIVTNEVYIRNRIILEGK